LHLLVELDVNRPVSVARPSILKIGLPEFDVTFVPRETVSSDARIGAKVFTFFGQDTVRADIVYPRKCVWVYAGVVVVIDNVVQIVALSESYLRLIISEIDNQIA